MSSWLVQYTSILVILILILKHLLSLFHEIQMYQLGQKLLRIEILKSLLRLRNLEITHNLLHLFRMRIKSFCVFLIIILILVSKLCIFLGLYRLKCRIGYMHHLLLRIIVFLLQFLYILDRLLELNNILHKVVFYLKLFD